MAFVNQQGQWTGGTNAEVCDKTGALRFRSSSNDPADIFEVHNPATGELLARVYGAGALEVDRVLQRARAAFRNTWRHVGPGERARRLRHAASMLREHADELAELETIEVGKPYEISRRSDLETCIASFEFFAGQAHALHGEFFPGGSIDVHTIPEPYGVVVGVIPFNWPPIHVAAKAAAALAAGNVVVLKSPEQCPFTVTRIVEVLQEAFPDDVIQHVPGIGAVAGAALVASPVVDRISFTGSTATAVHVLKAAAENITGSMLELGGKNPLIVFEDADIDSAVAGAIEGMFYNQGEACTSASRLLVERSVADTFTERFVEQVRKLRLGPPLNDGVHLGPMITAVHRDRVMSYVDVGLSEGARMVYRGEAPSMPELLGGFWVPPIVFDRVTPSMRIAKEEIFGPVASIIEFDGYDEAIAIANDTPFALVSAVYTRDELRQRRATRDIDAGVVFVNNYRRQFLPTPFGGNRASGYGREHASETMKEYMRSKSVRVPSGISEVPRWSGATSD